MRERRCGIEVRRNCEQPARELAGAGGGVCDSTVRMEASGRDAVHALIRRRREHEASGRTVMPASGLGIIEIPDLGCLSARRSD